MTDFDTARIAPWDTQGSEIGGCAVIFRLTLRKGHQANHPNTANHGGEGMDMEGFETSRKYWSKSDRGIS